jgi:hypothetical protein
MTKYANNSLMKSCEPKDIKRSIDYLNSKPNKSVITVDFGEEAKLDKACLNLGLWLGFALGYLKKTK